LAFVFSVVIGFSLALIAYTLFRREPAAPESGTLDTILSKQEQTLASVDEVLAAVQELPSINDSLDAVFAKLQELITAGQVNPAKLQEALDMVNAQKDRTKAAILANTPAA